MRKKLSGRPNRSHFDYPIFDEAEIEALITDPAKVAQHGFFPFLSFEIKTRRFQKDPKNKKRYKITEKKRPIRMAAHRDTYIFSHYSKLLSDAYERKIAGTPISEVAVAYRSGKGSNIDIANEVFEGITTLRNCVVIAADLKNFFETIDHEHLKKCWADLLGLTRLPPDHFQVFKAVTNYSYASVSDIKKALGLKDQEQLPKPIFKTPNEMRSVLRQRRPDGTNLITRNSENYGIPQGSPMSALLSNISMMDFDAAMAHYAASVGGLYRRYSDDILLAVPVRKYQEATEELSRRICDIPGPVSENTDKRVVSVFDQHGRLRRGSITLGGMRVNSRILQYLGFLFDGERVTIRSQTLARYWRKLTRGVRAAKRRAKKNPVDGKVFKRKIYRRFSHLGKRNLHSYKRNAISKMSYDGISRQFSNNWRQLQKEIAGPIKTPKRPSR